MKFDETFFEIKSVSNSATVRSFTAAGIRATVVRQS